VSKKIYLPRFGITRYSINRFASNNKYFQLKMVNGYVLFNMYLWYLILILNYIFISNQVKAFF